MRKIYLFILLQSAIITSVSANTSKITRPYFHTNAIILSDLDNIDTTYHIIRALDNTYGYEILIGNKILIRQLTIPGRAGTEGFKKKTDAHRVAILVLKKLSKGIMPPTIEKQDLEKLKIHY